MLIYSTLNSLNFDHTCMTTIFQVATVRTDYVRLQNLFNSFTTNLTNLIIEISCTQKVLMCNNSKT